MNHPDWIKYDEATGPPSHYEAPAPADTRVTDTIGADTRVTDVTGLTPEFSIFVRLAGWAIGHRRMDCSEGGCIHLITPEVAEDFRHGDWADEIVGRSACENHNLLPLPTDWETWEWFHPLAKQGRLCTDCVERFNEDDRGNPRSI